MNILDKYYSGIPKLDFYNLDYPDQIRVLTYAVGNDLPLHWKEFDTERSTSKQATARSLALNEKGRNGRSAMPKYTQDVLSSIPEDERGKDILNMSLESLMIMLKEVITNGNNFRKAKKFMNTLETFEGAQILFKTQIIVSGELLISGGHDIENGAYLQARLKAKGKAKGKISRLYTKFYKGEITSLELSSNIDEIMNQFTNEFLVSMSGMENAVEEKNLYDATNKDTLNFFITHKIDEIREQVTGQKRMFLPEE